jgi:hypothetical protein
VTAHEVTRASAAKERRGGIIVALLFAVLFGLAEVTPVSNLVALPAFYDFYGIGEAIPWVLLALGVAIPAVSFVLALVLGRGRPLFARALIFTVALASTFALEFGVMALAAAFQPAIS